MHLGATAPAAPEQAARLVIRLFDAPEFVQAGRPPATFARMDDGPRHATLTALLDDAWVG